MNVSEGVRRLALVIRYGGYCVGGVVALFALLIAFNSQSPLDQAGFMVGGTAIGAMVGGAGHVIAWILMGFAGSRAEPRNQGDDQGFSRER